jgi:hypothetical protein
MSQGAAPEYQRPYLIGPGGVPTSHTVQAAAEGVVMEDDGKVEFMGERFRLAEKIGLMPMLAFANASKNGLDSDDMAGLAAMYALIRDVVDQTQKQVVIDGVPQFEPDGQTPVWEGPSEWMRFEKHAIETQADGEDLMEFVSKAMAVVAARPRKPREVSSASSRPTSATSSPVSSSPVRRPEGFTELTPVSALGS